MTTRRTHTVRIKNPNQNGAYVDVQVLDAITFTGPNNFQMSFSVPAQGGDISVAIVDNTGDGNSKGNLANCTRASHMVRLTSQSDNTQVLDVEVCDAFVLVGPNNMQHSVVMPPKSSSAYIVDKTDSGLGVDFVPGFTTRTMHVVKLQGVFTDGTDDTNKDDFLLVEMLDGVAIDSPPLEVLNDSDAGTEDDSNYPWGLRSALIFPFNSDQTNDTTQLVDDPDNPGQKVPPDNTDPNIYVAFPSDSDGPFLGAHVPVNQGPLWWIKKVGVSPPAQPWYWYYPSQQVRDWSFFGVPPESTPIKWGYRGFQLLPKSSVIWILSVNNPLIPILPSGNKTLEDAVNGLNGSHPNGDIHGTMPNGANASQSDSPLIGTVGYGIVPLTDPPAEDVIHGVPNIWQMTGIKQPPLQNPKAPYDPVHNQYKMPSVTLAEKVVKTWAEMWNAVSVAANSISVEAPNRPSAPPVWPWVLPQPWHDPLDGTSYRASFQAGLPVGLFTGGIPPEVLTQGTADLMAVGQLDPKVWDTSVFPPVLKTP